MSLPYEHVSHSQLGSWLRCQKAFQLERLQRAPKIPAWWLVGGSAVHEVTEDLDRRMHASNLTPVELVDTVKVEELTRAKLEESISREEELSGIKSEEWFAAGRSPQGRGYWTEQAPKMVANWLIWRTQKGWPVTELDGQPAIELSFELKLTSVGSVVKGAPDRVLELPNGDLVVVDIKTGSSTPKEPLQLGLYATVLEVLGHKRPAYGTFVKVKEGLNTPLAPLAKYTDKYFEVLFTGFREQLEAAVGSGAFLPNVSDACRTCSVQAACYANSGALSADFDPLDPNYQGGS